MTNQSTTNARAIIEWLINHGVQDAVIAPGSRSAPLAYAFAQAQAAGALRIHVRIDERDAGFLALGLSKSTNHPVPVVVTSGTAVANLLPAVVEAFYSGIELVVVSADRPAVQRGQRSPQTILQNDLFGDYVRAVDVAVDAQVEPALKGLKRGSHKQPLHINAQFDLPLMPDDANWVPQTKFIPHPHVETKTAVTRTVPSRGLIIAGDINDANAALEISMLAEKLGWPIIWEPTSNLHSAANALSHGVLLLQQQPSPECIVTVGSVGLSRVVLAALKQTPEHLVIHLPSDGLEIPNPVGSAKEIFSEIPNLENAKDQAWQQHWLAADKAVAQIVASELNQKTLTGQRVAVDVWNHAGADDQLFIAASWPVRHVEAYAPTRKGLQTLGNRGANGIDGLVSSAWGSALGKNNRTYLLIGDIAFLHDVGGMNVSADELKPNLTIVVSDNDGSGIFGQLEQGAPEYAEHYEKIFGTPHGKDLWVIAESFGIPAQRVTTTEELQRALASTDKIPGVHVIVCTTGNRVAEAELSKRIAAQVAAQLQ